MEHMLLKAVTTAQDQGVFEAVISSSTVDREKDTVDPGGMVRALQRWIPTGKMIPLAWMHSTRAEDQIGYIDPSTARVVGHEVVASGWIDQTTQRGKDAWRLVKSRTLGFSFGYLVPEGGSTERKGGGRNISELDVFEVTATTVPMHNDTRVLGWKSAAVDTQRMRADALAREAEEGALPPADPAASPETAAREPTQAPTPAPDPSSQRQKASLLEREQAGTRRRAEEARIPDIPEEPTPEPPPVSRVRPVPDAGDLRRKAAEYERELLAEGREREATRIPDIPAATAEPNADPLDIPETEEQWRKAVAIEREQAHEARRREERELPAVPPAPPEPIPEPAPEPKAIPETSRQRKWAKKTERREAAERRRREADALPPVPSAPSPSPEPAREPLPAASAQRSKAARFERELDEQQRRRETATLPDVPPEPARTPAAPEPEFVPDGEAQRRKAAAYEREVAQAERRAEESKLPVVPEVKVSAEPFSASRTSNWVARGGGLPHYIQHIAHDLVDSRGMDESHAIAAAIAIAKRWAAGGKNVHADTQAKAAAAVAEWEKLKASHGKAVGDAVSAPPSDLEALAAGLTDAELADILEALCTRMMAQVPDQAPAKAIPDSGEQRQKARQIEREAARAMEEERIPEVPEGPRYESLQMTADEMTDLIGALMSNDLPNLRKTFARIPQSNLPPGVKDRLIAKAIEVLDTQSSKSADVTDDAVKARSVDPLRQRAESVALEHASGGESLRKPPQEKVASRPQPELSLDDLRQKSRDEMLMALSGLEDV